MGALSFLLAVRVKDLVAKIRIEAEATGDEKIVAMVRQLEQLAEQGLEAAPAFAELANKLRELQAQNGTGLADTAGQVDALGGAARSAEPAVDGLAGALEGVAQPDGLDEAAGQVGALGGAASSAAPAVDGLSNAIAGVAQPAGLDRTAGQVGALGSAATGAAPAVDELSSALAGVAQPDDLANTAGQMGALGGAATGAAPAVEDLSGAMQGVAQPDGLAEASGELRGLGDAAQAAQAGLDTLDIDTLANDIGRVGLGPLIDELERLAAQGGEMAPQFAQAAQELRALQANAAGGAEAVGEIAAEAEGAAGQVSGIGNAADTLQTKLNQVAAAVAGVFAIGQLQGYAADMIGVADAYGQMASRIENVTSSTAEYELVQRRLLETAGATYRPLAEAQELYIRTSDALKSLGYDTAQALDISDSFSYLLVTNAASADKAASAIDAYSKSIQSNKVEADSWSSIMAAMPTVVDALAQATGKSTAEIRELGVTGKLAVSDLNEALRQTVESNKAVAASMPTTVADALTNLATAWGAYIGEANRASGATQLVAGVIDMVTDNLDTLVGTAMKVGEVLLAAFGAKALIAAKGYVTELLASTTAVTANASAITRQGAAAATATPQLVGASSAAAKHGQVSATASGAAAAHASSTTRQGAAAATATPQLVGAATAASRQGQASTAAAGASTAHAAAMAKQGAAAGAAATSLTGFAGVLGKLKGVTSLLGFTALTLAVSAAIEYGRNLLFAKSAAEELEGALADAVKAADFSSADGVDAFIAQLREMQLEAELSAEQISKALSLRLAKIGADELAQLRDRLAEAFEAGGQGSKELEAALAAVDARLADIEKRANWGRALVTEAEAARFALSDLQKQFQAVGTEAEAVGGALKKMLADADLSSLGGIEKLAADLKTVQDSAYATGEQIDSALRERLASLTANELREFGIMAEMAFNQGKVGAEELARINTQVLAASFDQLGVNAAVALGQISPAAQEAIGAVDNIVKGLEQAGVEAGQAGVAIEMALTKAFASADSQQALDELIARANALGEAGKLGAEAFGRLANAATEALKRIEDLTPGIQSVEEAFRKLGIKSSDELKFLADEAKQAFNVIRESGMATPAELKAAFTAYAEAAIEANDGVADATIKSQARMLGLRVEADETGKTVVRTMEESAEAAKKLADATEKTSAGMSALGKAAAGAAAAGTTLAETWDEAGNLISEGMDKSVSAGRDAGELVGLYSEQQIRAIRTIDKALQEHTQNILRNHNERIIAAGAEERALDRLADQQSRLSSSAARGVDDLKLRLIELSGTEDEIARARLERDKADIARQIALAQLEIKRAMVRGESGEAARLREEIALLQEQLVLVDKVFKAEQRNAKSKGGGGGGGGGGGVSPSSGHAPAASNEPTRPAVPVANGPVLNITLNPGANLNDRAEVERFARLIMPEIQNLSRRGF